MTVQRTNLTTGMTGVLKQGPPQKSIEKAHARTAAQ